MARRDNQGLQIAMIVFILTTLVFMVLTYFGWSSSQKLQAQVDDLQSNLQRESDGLRRSEQLVSAFKRFTGLAELEADAIEQALQDAVATYGQGLPVENQNFQDIAARMMANNQDLTSKLAQASDTEQQLRAELAQMRTTTQEMIAQARAAETQAVEDMNRVERAAQEQQSKLDQQRSKLAAEVDAKQRAMQSLTAKTDSDIATVRSEMDTLKKILQDRNETLKEIEDPTPGQFDGLVIGVVHATRSIWLDKGRADGLLPKTTFRVFDADEFNIRLAKKKGSVEVTRILGDHRAEARITDMDPINPITQGDFIYSPIWDAGIKVGIALVGTLDVDGDGTEDRDYVRNLIEINGGRIDAEDVDGKVKGQMTVNTRYLVVGESAVQEGSQNPALSVMLNDAARLGVEQMSLKELLDLMGVTKRARSVSFTGVVRPGDFAPKPREGVTHSSPGTKFQKRNPVLRRRNMVADD